MTQDVSAHSGALARVAAAYERIRKLEAELQAERERAGLAVVEAHDVEGRSYREIARPARVTYGTIYKAYCDWAA